MKAFDKNGKSVAVEVTEEKPHIFLNGEEVAYSSLDYADQNRIDGKIDDLYDLPHFDGSQIFVGHPEIGWCVMQAAKLSSTTVINASGVEVDFAAAVELMDDGVRERLHSELAPCSDQEFFSAYELAHADEFSEVWELSKENPVY